jgi:hypothetical protein
VILPSIIKKEEQLSLAPIHGGVTEKELKPLAGHVGKGLKATRIIT